MAVLVFKVFVISNFRFCRICCRVFGLFWKASSTRGMVILSGEKMTFLFSLDFGSCVYRFKVNFWLLKNGGVFWIVGVRDVFEVFVGGVIGSSK